MSTHGGKELIVRRGRVDSVDLFEIKEHELDILEQGSNGGLDLNFAVAAFSLTIGAITALATATFINPIFQTLNVVIVVVGVLVTLYCGIRWWRSRCSVRELCAKIRQRIPPDVTNPEPQPAMLEAKLDILVAAPLPVPSTPDPSEPEGK